jgi:hypothetical protein
MESRGEHHELDFPSILRMDGLRITIVATTLVIVIGHDYAEPHILSSARSMPRALAELIASIVAIAQA